jgi:hypothetical protein
MHHQRNPDHARHDAVLIAAHAAGDLRDTDRTRAERLLASCSSCAELRRDLVSIAAATRAVPAPASLRRDLRLDPAQADRLRGGSWLRAFLRQFGSIGSPVRPMATAFTSLGIAGLLFGVVLSSGFSLGSAGSRPAAEDAGAMGVTQATPGPAASVGAAPGGEGEPLQGASFRVNAANQATKEPGDRNVQDRGTAAPQGAAGGAAGSPATQELASETDTTVDPGRPFNPLIAGSLALLGIGLILFGLRIAARRVR